MPCVLFLQNTLRKLECFEHEYAPNALAWNNKLDIDSFLLVSRTDVMINRDSWGNSYLTVRGEILGFIKNDPMRKHLPNMFSLIKN